MPVRVYEAQPEYNPVPRTLIVTSAWLRLLDFDSAEAVLNRAYSFELISRGTTVRIRLREPDVILERSRFLRVLAREVERSGAELVLGHHLEAIADQDSRLSLCFNNGRGTEQRHTCAVVGADGVSSAVGQALGQDRLERVALVQARVPLPVDLAPDTVRVWFDLESTRFFIWLIPESKLTGALGLIADSPQQAKQALERFLTVLDIQSIEYQAAWVPLHPLHFGARAHTGRREVLLVGDAAGQVKTSTIGGVVTGMRGGAAAARSLIGSESYSTELQPLHRELNFHAAVRNVLDCFTDEDYDQLLRLLNHRALRVLQEYNRDELAFGIWRLLPAQPRWLLLGARALLRGFRRVTRL